VRTFRIRVLGCALFHHPNDADVMLVRPVGRHMQRRREAPALKTRTATRADSTSSASPPFASSTTLRVVRACNNARAATLARRAKPARIANRQPAPTRPLAAGANAAETQRSLDLGMGCAKVSFPRRRLAFLTPKEVTSHRCRGSHALAVPPPSRPPSRENLHDTINH
jgi:hypothetical protein